MAAHQHPKQYFQAGLQFRSDPQRDFLVDYVRTGAWGQTVSARSQWHKKNQLETRSSNQRARKGNQLETRQKPFYRIDRRNRYPSARRQILVPGQTTSGHHRYRLHRAVEGWSQ